MYLIHLHSFPVHSLSSPYLGDNQLKMIAQRLNNMGDGVLPAMLSGAGLFRGRRFVSNATTVPRREHPHLSRTILHSRDACWVSLGVTLNQMTILSILWGKGVSILGMAATNHLQNCSLTCCSTKKFLHSHFSSAQLSGPLPGPWSSHRAKPFGNPSPI